MYTSLAEITPGTFIRRPDTQSPAIVRVVRQCPERRMTRCAAQIDGIESTFAVADSYPVELMPAPANWAFNVRRGY